MVVQYELAHELVVENPYSGDPVANVKSMSAEDAESAVQLAYDALGSLARTSRAERAGWLDGAANLLESDHEEFAKLITVESGKIITQARAEVSRAINTLRVSARACLDLHGEEIPFDSHAGGQGRFGYFMRAPLGVIVGITPFNDPLNLVAHKIGPAIAGGNAIVLKPSEYTPLSALRLGAALKEAGLPEGGLSIVTGDHIPSQALVKHRKVRMVSFTGGYQTAQRITQKAGVKKFGFDLGGNAPVIVCEDSDIDLAVDACASGAFWANGHNCISVQRILVHQAAMDRFQRQFIEHLRALRIGDPLDETTDIGPLAHGGEVKRLAGLINEIKRAGGKIVIGGEFTGNCLQPTLVTGLPADHELVSQEAFGPIVFLSEFRDYAEAVRLANHTDAALNCGVFSNNLDLVRELVEYLSFSSVLINDSSDFRFDDMPFGGFKSGSVGREGVRFAIQEMTQTKTVCFAPLKDRVMTLSEKL